MKKDKIEALNGTRNPLLEATLHKFKKTGDILILKSKMRKSKLFLVTFYVIIIFVSILIPLIFGDFFETINQKTLAALFIGFLFTWLAELYSRTTGEKQNETKLEMIAYKEQESEEIRKENDLLLKNLWNFLTKLGYKIENITNVKSQLNKLADLGDTIDDEFVKILQGEDLEIYDAYTKLKEKRELIDTYEHQFDLARHFALMSKNKFWATSTDRISTFQKKNYDYYDAMNKIYYNLKDLKELKYNETEMPRFCRLFAGESRSFAADIINDHKYFIELYKMHLFWGGKKIKHLYPIRFFLNDNNELNLTLERILGTGTIIQDFMIVDDKLVYGREGTYATDSIKLKLITDNNAIKMYEDTFFQLWKEAKPINDLVQLIFHRQIGYDENQKSNFLKIITNIEKKLDVPSDYRNMFPKNHWEGANFFQDVCNHIANARNSIIAIDRASKKTNNLWKAWMNEREYLEFFESCTAATKKGTSVYRLFIKEPGMGLEQKDDAVAFIKKAIENCWLIRFINSTDITSLEMEYLYDFIIIGLPIEQLLNNPKELEGFDWKIKEAQNVCLGFELLGDQYFTKSALSLYDNLIAKELLNERAQIFQKLWDHERVIKLEKYDQISIDNFIDKIFSI